jgi:hypothetical protein
MLMFSRVRPRLAACEESQMAERFGEPGQCADPSVSVDDGSAGPTGR